MPSWPIFFTIKWFLCEEVLELFVPLSRMGGGEKIPSLSPVLKLTPSSLDIFMDYRRCYRGGFKMTKRMIYVGFPKNDYPIHGDSPSKLGRAFSLSVEKKWVEGNSSVPFCK